MTIYNLYRRIHYEAIQERVGAFGPYQIRLCLATQLGYVTAAASLLCSTYLALQSKNHCFHTNSTFSTEMAPCDCQRQNFETSGTKFYSLLDHLGLNCEVDYLPTLMNTCVMGGGVLGATLFGHIADQVGRKLVCFITIGGLCLFDLLLMTAFNIFHDLILLFIVGLFAGAYMVTNSIIIRI